VLALFLGWRLIIWTFLYGKDQHFCFPTTRHRHLPIVSSCSLAVSVDMMNQFSKNVQSQMREPVSFFLFFSLPLIFLYFLRIALSAPIVSILPLSIWWRTSRRSIIGRR
jgi:hypothetical protein